MTLEADYVVIGSGAVGLAFADALLAESAASILIVDRQSAPGGHWRDAYPFLRLHSASFAYGVASTPLGGERVETDGLNRGHYELAGAAEIRSYFETVMRERLAASGRVTYLPLHEHLGDGRVRARLSGEVKTVRWRRKLVDATFGAAEIPARTKPRFAAAEGARCIAPGALVDLDAPSQIAVLGAGKTALDAALWLLAQDVAPERILWVRPREPWLLNRRFTEPTDATFERTFAGLACEFEALAEAHSLDDLFARLERAEVLRRIDVTITPTMYRCAIVSDAELLAARRIERVVRLGRVTALRPGRIILEEGEVATEPDCVYVNCTTDGLGARAPEPIFDADRITLQYVRRCSPVLSAALLGVVEARLSETEKAAISPVPPPREPLDWVRMHRIDAANRAVFARHPDIGDWLARCRLDGYSGAAARARASGAPEKLALLKRYRDAMARSAPALERLLGA